MPVQKIKSGRVNVAVDTFVGDNGVIFFDESQGDLRLGDGVTPGGIPLTFSGGGGGGNYTLPTASTTVKGGVKIDGTTIGITNQVISVVNGVFTTGSYNNPSWITSLDYAKLTNTPSIPTNTNQLTNGAGFITNSALSGYATISYVLGRGYLTSVSWNDVASKPTFATVATSGSYADLTNKPTLFSGSYNDLTNKPTLFSGSYADLTNKPTLFSGSYADLTNKPTIPTDISQLTDTQGLLGQGGGGSGTTVITNNIQNPYTFSVAGDDSTLREISNGETLRFAGATGITITSDAEGKITITGPDLSTYATQSYVTSQGYITSSALTGYATETYVTTRGYLTSVSWNDVSGKPTLFSGSYTDLTNKPTIPTNTNELTNGAGFITSSALTGYATETYVTTRGYLTAVSWNDVSGKPTFATVATSGSYADLTNKPTLFSGSYNDLTNKPTLFSGSYADLTNKPSIPTNTNELTNGAGFITSSALTGYATETYVTTRGYLTTVGWSDIQSKPTFASVSFTGSWNDLTDKPNLAGTYSWNIAADDSTQIEVKSDNTIKFVGSQGITTTSNADGQITIAGPDLSSYATQSYVTTALANAGVIVSETAPTGQPEGKLWYNSADLELYVRYDDHWVATSASFSGDYNDLTNKPTNVSQFNNDAGYTTRDEVYAMILELAG